MVYLPWLIGVAVVGGLVAAGLWAYDRYLTAQAEQQQAVDAAAAAQGQVDVTLGRQGIISQVVGIVGRIVAAFLG